MNKTDYYLKELSNLASLPLSTTVVERLKLALIDYIGVTLAGAKTNQKELQIMLRLTDQGSIPVIGVDKLLSMESAVFFNGLNAHALDFDDGTNSGIIHLGSPIFSVLLPLARKYKVPVEKFIRAVILGYEASYTMAISIQPRHKSLGYHATGTCGTLGIAVAIAHLLDFTPAQRKNAFSTAAVSASGTLKVLEDGSDLKPYNVAKAALMGYTSAIMGLAGFQGPEDVLSGDRGFLRIMHGSDDIELKSLRLGGTYAMEKAYIKPYAACRYCHPSIEAAVCMRNEHEIASSDIDRIQVKTYSLAVNKHDHTEILGEGSAKMSIPYSVAVALVKGKAGLPEFDSGSVTDAEVLALTKRVEVGSDEEISRDFPAKQTAVVDIVTKDKRTYSMQVDFPKGEPENPLSIDEAREKFTTLTLFSGRSAEEAEEIFDAVMDLENQFEKILDIINYSRNHPVEDNV